MNIIVRPYGSDLCYCRPDTTWERENRDFYSPECVNEISWTPIVFVRICKAGKCIGAKFAERYYDAAGCGILMYCNDAEMAFSSCVDHTSILPYPLEGPEIFGQAEAVFTVTGKTGRNCADERSYSINGKAKDLIHDAICRASRLTSLRIGDHIAVELDTSVPLASRKDGEAEVKGSFCGRDTFDFKIIF